MFGIGLDGTVTMNTELDKRRNKLAGKQASVQMWNV